jgi:transketolase
MTEKMSMRVAYGKALVALGAANPKIVVLDADVSSSTQSHFFAAAYPERFFNVGIAEPGMVDVAAGLALCGKIPFANTFAFLFALRATEQIRTHLAYGHANVKLAAGYAGLSDSFDGPTHHSISDLAIMRSLPGLCIVAPADTVEMEKLLPQIADYPGPVYLRLCRNEVPVLFDAAHAPQIGKGVLLRSGSDVTIVNCGVLLGRCLEAADRLAQAGIGARVINLHTLKPLDEDIIRLAALTTGAIVTVEEHSVIGGLGGAISEFLSETSPVPVLRVGLRDTFAETGPYDALLDRFGMGVEDIVKQANAAIALKNIWKRKRGSRAESAESRRRSLTTWETS